MRYEKGRKSATKRRIVDVASKRLREGGYASLGLTAVMKEVGLTNGGFYFHFDSKESLACEALVHAIDAGRDDFSALFGGEPDLERVLRGYLNASHRDALAAGSPSAVLLPEIARHSTAMRAIYEGRLLTFVELISKLLPRHDDAKSRMIATAMFGLLIGTLQLARAVSTKSRSDEILEAGVQAALVLARSA